ncbi:MAG: tetratricopeptide repeat protein [Rhodanobacter sp.]
MRFLLKHLLSLPLLLAVFLVAGCSLFSRTTPKEQTVPSSPGITRQDMVAAIRAAGADDNSVIDVKPLRDPAVAALVDASQQDDQSGKYVDAAGKLDQALKITPESPDLLQDRAELAVRLGDFVSAEKLAHQSWSLGPRLGPLCARNWQTIVEVRLQASDPTGASAARKWVQQCRKADIPRY